MLTELFGRTGQRLAAFGVAALILKYIGVETNSVLPWALLIIVVLLEFLSYQHGIIEGIVMYRNLTPSQRRELDNMMDEGNNGK